MGKANQHSFEPGTSGNPTGRPPKTRALTTLLEKQLEKKNEGAEIERREVMAEIVAQLVSQGHAKFPDGTSLEIAPREWLDLVKWVYAQIDGPPKNDDELRKLTDAEIIALATGGTGRGD